MADFERIIDEANGLLDKNLVVGDDKWESRYAGYAKNIRTHKPKGFCVKPPFSRYTCVDKARQKSAEFDLRVAGQSVATVSVDTVGKVTISTKGKDDSNWKYFGVTQKLPDGTLWHSKAAEEFRRQFQHTATESPKSPEHRLENRLLKEFEKHSSVDKALCNIQPVKLNDAFLQMPTPFSASNGIAYSGHSGGGIDILSRVKHGAKDTRLCVMELKDENKSSEPPAKVAEQALVYAVFLARLLRSKSGNEWYHLLGLNPLFLNNFTLMLPLSCRMTKIEATISTKSLRFVVVPICIYILCTLKMMEIHTNL